MNPSQGTSLSLSRQYKGNPYPANVAGLLYERGLRLSGKLKEDTLLCGCIFLHSASSHGDMHSKAPFQFLLSLCVCGGGVNQISNLWIQFRVTSCQDVQRNSAWLIPKWEIKDSIGRFVFTRLQKSTTSVLNVYEDKKKFHQTNKTVNLYNKVACCWCQQMWLAHTRSERHGIALCFLDCKPISWAVDELGGSLPWVTLSGRPSLSRTAAALKRSEIRRNFSAS